MCLAHGGWDTSATSRRWGQGETGSAPPPTVPHTVLTPYPLPPVGPARPGRTGGAGMRCGVVSFVLLSARAGSRAGMDDSGVRGNKA